MSVFQDLQESKIFKNEVLSTISTIISVLIFILPGYLTGWYSKQNATVNGLIVIFMCASVKSFGFSLPWDFQLWVSFGFFIPFIF